MAASQAAGTADGSPQHTLELTEEQKQGLAELRKPFPESAIAKRPQPWCKACNNSPTKVCQNHKKYLCRRCNQNITEAHIDLSYVGHAELTDRLLDADPAWDWEPLAWDENGLPKFDQYGGLWIRLTVCGVTRKGYGDAQGKPQGPNAVKEIIGDALRNAAMRFGAALDLWAKTDLHADEEPAVEQQRTPTASPQAPRDQQEALAALQQRVMNAWNHLGGTEQNLREAEAKSLLSAKVPGPDGEMYEVGALLRDRITELQRQQRSDLYTASGMAGSNSNAKEVA